MKIFLSWSDNLTGFVAECFRKRLQDALGSKVEPFLSKQMEAGIAPIQEISSQLAGSDHGLLFLARDNLSPPWVVFEAGAVGKRLRQSRVVPIAVGFPAGLIEPPLLLVRQGISICYGENDSEQVRKLFLDICRHAEGNHDDYSRVNEGFDVWYQDLCAQVKKLLVASLSGGEDWSLVKPTKLAEVTRHSPFEAKDAFRIASERLVFVGQNLFSLVGKERPLETSWFYLECMGFLKGTRDVDAENEVRPGIRRVDIVVLDPDEPHLKEAWGRSVGDAAGFSVHLTKCVDALKELLALAANEDVGTQIHVRLAKYIPLSATFVDPENMVGGALFLRPFTRGDRPQDRPIVLITRRANPRAFEFYWTRHEADFDGELNTRTLDMTAQA